MENPIKMDDLRVPPFYETPIYAKHITQTSESHKKTPIKTYQNGERHCIHSGWPPLRIVRQLRVWWARSKTRWRWQTYIPNTLYWHITWNAQYSICFKHIKWDIHHPIGWTCFVILPFENLSVLLSSTRPPCSTMPPATFHWPPAVVLSCHWAKHQLPAMETASPASPERSSRKNQDGSSRGQLGV